MQRADEGRVGEKARLLAQRVGEVEPERGEFLREQGAFHPSDLEERMDVEALFLAQERIAVTFQEPRHRVRADRIELRA